MSYMKKETLEKELQASLTEAQKISEKVDLALETTLFLRGEQEKLGAKMEKEQLPVEEQELLMKQITALRKRIEKEIEMVVKDFPRTEAINERLKYLETISVDEQTEE